MDIGFDAVMGFFARLPADWIVIGVFIVIVALDFLRGGAKRACSLALALPAAVFVFAALQSAVLIGDISRQFSTPALQSLLFAIVVIIMYILVNKISVSYGGESGKPVQAALAGIAVAAITIIVWTQTPALSNLWNFGTQVQSVFGEAYRFWWLIGSYATLAFVRKS